MSLDKWGDIIRHQGEARRREQDEQTQTMLKELPEKLAMIPTCTGKELVDGWMHFNVLSYGYMTPWKQTAIFRLLRRTYRRELLARLSW